MAEWPLQRRNRREMARRQDEANQAGCRPQSPTPYSPTSILFVLKQGKNERRTKSAHVGGICPSFPSGAFVLQNHRRETHTVLQNRTMRSLTSILALLGAIWALAGIAGWIMTISSIQYVESGIDAAKMGAAVILLLSGYFVWWGWVFYSFKERFPILTTRSFWICSLIHHIACVLYLIPMDVWGGGDDPWWIPVWIIGNVVIALNVLFRQPAKKVEAE